MKNRKGRNLIFLISQPRAGSTMMQRVIGGHQSIFTSSEAWIMLHPLFALREAGIVTEFGSDLARQATIGFIGQFPRGIDDYNELMQKNYSQMYQRVLDSVGKSRYLDKTPRYYLIIKELYNLFPEAKYVLLFRNPLSVLASIISNWTKGDWYRLAEFKSDLIDAPACLIEGADILGNDALSVSYEKFLENPQKSLKRITDYLDVRFSPESVNYGDHFEETWEFGDQHTISEKKRPDKSHVNKWTEILQNPQSWRVINDYLEYLGINRLKRMGYEYELCRTILDQHKPNLDINKNSVALGSLLEQTNCYMLANSSLKHQLNSLQNQFNNLNRQIDQDNTRCAEMLHGYIEMKWKELATELSGKKVAVYGSKEYCVWLYRLTKNIDGLKPTAVLIDNNSESVELWNNTSVTTEVLRKDNYDAIILATECYQKRYIVTCRELCSEEVVLIDLYEKMSSGPYPKFVDNKKVNS